MTEFLQAYLHNPFPTFLASKSSASGLGHIQKQFWQLKASPYFLQREILLTAGSYYDFSIKELWKKACSEQKAG